MAYKTLSIIQLLGNIYWTLSSPCRKEEFSRRAWKYIVYSTTWKSTRILFTFELESTELWICHFIAQWTPTWVFHMGQFIWCTFVLVYCNSVCFWKSFWHYMLSLGINIQTGNHNAHYIESNSSRWPVYTKELIKSARLRSEVVWRFIRWRVSRIKLWTWSIVNRRKLQIQFCCQYSIEQSC